jgi:hypothetical protein
LAALVVISLVLSAGVWTAAAGLGPGDDSATGGPGTVGSPPLVPGAAPGSQPLGSGPSGAGASGTGESDHGGGWLLYFEQLEKLFHRGSPADLPTPTLVAGVRGDRSVTQSGPEPVVVASAPPTGPSSVQELVSAVDTPVLVKVAAGEAGPEKNKDKDKDRPLEKERGEAPGKSPAVNSASLSFEVVNVDSRPQLVVMLAPETLSVSGGGPAGPAGERPDAGGKGPAAESKPDKDQAANVSPIDTAQAAEAEVLLPPAPTIAGDAAVPTYLVACEPGPAGSTEEDSGKGPKGGVKDGFGKSGSGKGKVTPR